MNDQSNNSQSFDELTHKNIKPLLWQYALPAIIGTVVNTLYNIIDGVFIGHWIGTEALSGLGVVLPIMNIIAAIGMLVGIGSASRLSISLGYKDFKKAEQIVASSVLLTLALSGVAITLLFIFLKPLLMFVGASEITYPYARDFLIIFLPGSLFLVLCFNLNNLMRASGFPFKAMVTMLISVFANILLAPLFISVFNLGMHGAAIATTISMAIGFLFVLQHFLDKQSPIRLKMCYLTFDLDIIKSIISIGMSPFCMQMAASAVVILINFQLRQYANSAGITGDYAIAAFSNANRLIMLIVMIVIGLTQGMQPIIGYNYGAKNFKRVKETLFYTIKVATCITTTGFLLSFFIPELFVKAFSSDPELVKLSAKALHFFTLAFPLAGFQMVAASFFQCIGMPSKAIFLSLSRQVLFLIPLLAMMPKLLGLDGVWLAPPASDVLATVVAAILLFYFLKKHPTLGKS